MLGQYVACSRFLVNGAYRMRPGDVWRAGSGRERGKTPLVPCLLFRSTQLTKSLEQASQYVAVSHERIVFVLQKIVIHLVARGDRQLSKLLMDTFWCFLITSHGSWIQI